MMQDSYYFVPQINIKLNSMEQIVAVVETIDWTCGEIGHFDITIRKKCRAKIDWGDGYVKSIVGVGKTQHFQHSYKHRLPIRTFCVKISTTDEDAILSYCHGFIDMNRISVRVTDCKGLLELNVTRSADLEITNCPNLKDIILSP